MFDECSRGMPLDICAFDVWVLFLAFFAVYMKKLYSIHLAVFVSVK